MNIKSDNASIEQINELYEIGKKFHLHLIPSLMELQ